MKQIKGICKKVLIIYLIIYITFASITSCFARAYDDECGEYVSQYAIDFVNKYQNYPHEYISKKDEKGIDCAKWTGGSEGSGTFYSVCTTFVRYIYQNALGIDITDYGIAMRSKQTYAKFKNGGTSYVQVITNASDLKAGDILVKSSHTELYVGNSQTVTGGHSLEVRSLSRWHIGSTAIGLRLTSNVEANPTGTVPLAESEEEDDYVSIYDENGFIYSGIGQIEGYEASKSVGSWLISMLTQILDYLVGMITLGIRMVVVGWTAIVERVFIDGIVNSVTGINNERVDGWEENPESIDSLESQTDDSDDETEEETTTSKATGEPGDENYISEGVQSIADIGGKVQLNTSSEANVTIENIVYNKIPILDINFFNFESAGGAVVDENGIIYIIKTNVAMWYYVFRILAMAIMLLVLIYLGIKMTISTAAEKKAVYKEMILSWLVGFVLVFAITYIMYAVIEINEVFIDWIIPEYEDGSEISLYESVRTKAYSLKATTGFAGLIMYIILVYYAIRFLIVYFKRFLTVMILALISPFMGIAYAIEKINKKGRGRRRNIWKLA